MINQPNIPFPAKMPITLNKSDSLTNLSKTHPKLKEALCQHDLYTIKNLTNVVVYIWLKNGASFWYYVSYFSGNNLVGYMLNQNIWSTLNINYNSILRYY